MQTPSSAWSTALLVAALAGCPAPTETPHPDIPPVGGGGAIGLTQEPGSTRDVDVATLIKDREAGQVSVLVDVRTQAEWDGGHVPGAVHIPLDQLDARVAELEAHRKGEVYVICQSGGRSSRAVRVLAGHGFSAVNVQGGTGGWIAAGQPVSKP